MNKNELIRAIDNNEIFLEETKKEYIIHWYARKLKCIKEYINEYNNKIEYM